MRKHKFELLAPAGSFESLKAAIQNGADAVYLGGGKFNARINADNFTGEDLAKAIDYVHERGKKIYITLNTLLKDEELNQALEFARYIYHQGADAVIIQDLGLLRLLNKYLPDLEIHASTQTTTVDHRTISELEKLGVKRVVLARELSYDEIKNISLNSNIELEVFVHGALCVCYSGQCLMSSFIGGRSGNRGLCAQPCRLPYSVLDDSGKYSMSSYILSTRDLSAIDFLPQLRAAGISSLKLEGRMKSPEYVAVVTSVYRKYIDLLEANPNTEYRVEDQDRKKLLQAFSRGGFTNSYLENNRNPAGFMYPKYPKNQGVLIGKVVDIKPPYVKIALEEDIKMGDGIEIHHGEGLPGSLIVTDIMIDNKHEREAFSGSSPWVGDVKGFVKKGSKVYRTLSKALFDEARTSYEGPEEKLVPLHMHITLKIGEKAVLEAKDIEGNSVCVRSDITAEEAINRPLDEKRIKEQLQKTGNTPYYLHSLDLDTDNKSIIPISALNELRRSALEKISEIRRLKSKRNIEFDREFDKNIYNSSQTQKNNKTLELSAFFYEFPEDLTDFDKIVSRVYLPVSNEEELDKAKKEFSGQIFLWTYPVLKDAELDWTIKNLCEVSEYFDGITYGSLGALKVFKEAFPEKMLCTEYSMNIFNNEALRLHKELGAETAVLSPELTLLEAEKLSCQGLKLEAAVFGRFPLMVMENCPSGADKGCSGLCEKCSRRDGYLKDRKGKIFPYVRNPLFGRTQIFNSNTLFMDDTESLEKTDFSLLRLIFTKDNMEYGNKIANYFYNRIKDKGYRDDQLVRKIKEKGYTKGHWFRGV